MKQNEQSSFRKIQICILQSSEFLGRIKKYSCLSFHFSPETSDRRAREFFLFIYLFIFIFHIGLFSEEKRVLHHTDMYFNLVLKCPIDLKTTFGMGVLE